MKITKIITILMMLVCFSVFLTLTSASLYEDFGQLESQKCEIEDYGKFSSSGLDALKARFETTSYSDCTIVVDYFDFEQETLDLIEDVIEDEEYFSYPIFYFPYGEIRHAYQDYHNYIVLLGENESALNDIVNLVANYDEGHDAKLRWDYAIFYTDDYFRLYEEGYSFVVPPEEDWIDPSDCNDDPSANIYTSNNGTFGDSIPFNSSCIDNTLLAFYYCNVNQEVDFMMHSCNCEVDRCIADVSEVFHWIRWFGDRGVTQELINSAIKSWIN